MEDSESLPDSPGANALQPISPDRVNHQNPITSPRNSINANNHRDSRIHDKIRQFNNLAHLPPNTSSMSKQLERKTADAALKRAMIGREEAESEMRRYRDEARVLRKQVEEGRERERKVGERLETVMVCCSLCSAFILPVPCLVLTCIRHVSRRTMGEPKKPIHIPRPYGRRKFDERARRHSNHSPPLSNYKKSSKRHESPPSRQKNASNGRNS